jgi:hypothetical protein
MVYKKHIYWTNLCLLATQLSDFSSKLAFKYEKVLASNMNDFFSAQLFALFWHEYKHD